MKPTPLTPTRRYFRVHFKDGKPHACAGTIMIRPDQIKHYACALGCKLMRHLPPELK